MLNKIPSQDSNFEEIWKEMDDIELLTPTPSKKEQEEASLKAYREAALSDSYMFGEYNGYDAYGDIPD